MENNCLVTKFRAEVNNNSMPYMGWMTVKVLKQYPYSYEKKVVALTCNQQGKPLLKVIDGEAYADLQLTIPLPLDTVLNSNGAFTTTFMYLKPNGTASALVVPSNLWSVFRTGSISPQEITGNGLNEDHAKVTVDFDALGSSNASIIFLENVVYEPTGFRVESNHTIENLIIKKFRTYKKIEGRVFDNMTTGFVPCIRNAQPTILENQKAITWRGEPFYNKHLYFNFDYDNDKVNVFDTATVVDSSNYTVSNKIAEYNDTTGQWTFL